MLQLVRSQSQNFLQIVKINPFFAFLKNYQGIENEGPSDDVKQFKYCASMLTDIGYGTIRLPKEDFAEDWGKSALDSKTAGGKASETTAC